MPTRRQRHATPVDLVALSLCVQRNERMSRAEQVAEAKRLRASLGDEATVFEDDAERLLWLIHEGDDPAVAPRTAQARSAIALVGLILVVAGLLSGVGLALAVFYYDGRAPVNVVAALGVFVLLQMVLLLLAVVAALPRGWVGWLPGTEGVQEALRLASPGRLALLAARFLPQDLREALAAALGRNGAHQRVYGRVQLWAVLRWSQLYALALNAAAVTTFVYLVFFSDLAFGWSTTLDIEPDRFHQLVHAIALPWSWQAALTPSLELVEQSRYFRGTAFDPEFGGAWWSFVLTAMLVYGLLPRVIAFAVASQRLRNASTLALRSTPGAAELLALMRVAPTMESNDNLPQQVAERMDVVASPSRRPYVIDWSRSAGSAERSAELLGLELLGYQSAGGSRSVEEDRQAIEAVAREAAEDGVVMLVKLWEPPMIETTEFLREVRGAVGDRVPIHVVPVACDAAGRVIGDDPVLVEQWRQRVVAMGDPWTQVTQPLGGPPQQTEQR